MEPALDPLTLRLFVAVCEARSIAAAAQREALVASAVSKRIAALEERLAVRLLVRGRRGVVPTAAGEALLRQAHEVLGALERLRIELEAFAGGVSGSVRVAASLSALAGPLPDDVAAFLARHARLRVSLDERAGTEVAQAVRGGAADLGVVWDEADTGGLECMRYRSDQLGVAMPAGHPLAQRRTLRLADTLAHPSIGVAPGGLLDRLMRRQAARLGRDLQHRMQVASLEAALRIVAAGLGLAVVPLEVVTGRTGLDGVVARPLADAWAERRLVVVSRGPASTSAAARLLAAHLDRTSAPGRGVPATKPGRTMPPVAARRRGGRSPP